MKKSLLLMFAAGCLVVANAQTTAPAKLKAVKAAEHARMIPPTETGMGSTAFHPVTKPNHKAVRRHQLMATTVVKFGSCYNLLGVINSACSQVDVDPNLNNIITFGHREDFTKPDGSGTYEASYSKDGGNTWDSNAVFFKSGTIGTRYPNAVIVNTKGNTVDSLAYVVMAGPHTDGNTSSPWDTNSFGSIQLSGTGANINEQNFLMFPQPSGETSYSPPIYMQACDDSMIHAISDAWTYNTAFTATYGWYGAQTWDGTWSSGTKSVTWTNKVIRPNFKSYDGTGSPFDSNAEMSQVIYAWSQDGMTGYIVMFGNLDSTGYSYASLQPIVFKTTNAGVTWTMMPPHNFDNDPVLTKYLRPALDSAGAVKAPYWDINGDNYHDGHGVDATVDMNGNLHIFGAIESAALVTPDSGGYTFNQPSISTMYIYDVYTTTAGGWGATFLDSLMAPFGVEYANTGMGFPTPWTYGTSGLPWGSRIQATRSQDGKKIFCTWLDDNLGDSCTLYPDIYSIGIDVSANMMTAPMQFTSTGNNYFLQVSGKAYSSSCTGGNFWNIPCVIIANAEATNDGTSPVTLNYIQGVGFCDDQFTIPLGVNEVVKNSTPFTVSANFPNPFNKQTSFNINLTEESSVSVDVFNTVGQKVWSKAAETMSPGKHMVTIDGSSLSAGVYFYRVIANGYAVTQKMIVE